MQNKEKLLEIAKTLIELASEIVEGQFAQLRKIPRVKKRVEDQEEIFLSEEEEKKALQKAVELPMKKEEAIETLTEFDRVVTSLSGVLGVFDGLLRRIKHKIDDEDIITTYEENLKRFERLLEVLGEIKFKIKTKGGR